MSSFTVRLLILSTIVLTESVLAKDVNPSNEACVGLGYLKGLLSTIDNVANALTDITYSAKKKNDAIGDKICGGGSVDIPEEDLCVKAEQDCEALQKKGFTASGIYRIWPRYLNHSIRVYCDMETEGGGWIVFQRRGNFTNPHLNFYENWDAYKKGFGNLHQEFWLGNEALFALTNQQNTTLRIDLEDFENDVRYAVYKDFLVSSEIQKYKMTIGAYSGNAGDSLSIHNNKEFSTKDGEYSCPKTFKGGWWYAECHKVNLNGQYLGGQHASFADGINWFKFRGHNYSLKRTEMKIRSH